VRRYLLGVERHVLDAGLLADNKVDPVGRIGAHMHRHTALEIRQPEGVLPVAAIGRSDQVEENVVLRDRQQLAVAKRPAGRRKVAAEQANLTDKWLAHELSPVRKLYFGADKAKRA